MSLIKVLITGQFFDGSGQPLSGQIEFSPVEPITDIESGIVVPKTPITIGLSEGSFEVPLYTDGESVYDVLQTIFAPDPKETKFVIQVPAVEKATLANLMTTKQQLAEIEQTAEEELEEARATAFLQAVKDLQDFVAEKTATLQELVHDSIKLLTEDVNSVQAKADEAFTVTDPNGRILTPYELRTSYAGTWPQTQALGMHNSDDNAHSGGFTYLRWGTGEPSDSLPTTVLFWLRFDGESKKSSKTHIYFRSTDGWAGIA